jgi:hypothetical protein
MDAILGSYDKSKIGSLIAWGGDHFVYKYGLDKVIKFSIIEFLMGKDGRVKLEKDYLASKKYFGKYILETEFKISSNNKFIGAIQPKVTGKYLYKEDLSDPVILGQFKEIMAAYYGLIAAGNEQIDLVGNGGIFKDCLSNIFVTPNKELVIIDTTLLEFKGIGIFYIVFYFILHLAIWRNNMVIKNFMS